MKNTDFSFSSLDFVISSDDALMALKDMVADLDLEITDIKLV